MDIDQLAINTIRILSAEAVQKANSGHPGMPMGAAPMAYTLWAKHMKHNPKNPDWVNRDRFVLSAGHGSMLLYSLLHLFRYGLSMEDIRQFRQTGSKTPGHPEYGHTVGVETTTGPLGQGFATSVGMAIAESYLADRFNKDGYPIVDHYTFSICGDGCMMEGISSEAASLAGTLRLGKLIVLYDSNSISIEGSTDIAFREAVPERFKSYGWQVIEINDGNDVGAIGNAIESAKKETAKPTLIKISTIIGYGSPGKQGKASAHGEPLGEDDLAAAKKFFGWTEEPFTVPSILNGYMDETADKLAERENEWNMLFGRYRSAYPELSSEYEKWMKNDFASDILSSEGFWDYEGNKASRLSSNEVLNKLSGIVPNLIGGAADLAPSTKTIMSGLGDFTPENHGGPNLHFGVREHAMAAITSGISLHGGLKPYAATFLVFSDYMKPAIRMAAIMRLPVIYVFTHDSVGLGEDGPTHQPVEHLLMLRSIPNVNVIRPADAKETAAAWYIALSNRETPTALILSRQSLKQYESSGEGLFKGAYVIKEASAGNPDLILIASGSEVGLIFEAASILEEKGIATRVVSMPSWKLFDEQDKQYKQSILPDGVKKMAVEAGTTLGWHKYTGMGGDIMGIDRFGASGPGPEVYELVGLTVDKVVRRALSLVKASGGFHHVAMKVKDFDKVVEFYTAGLGFEKGICWGDGEGRAVMIDIGNDNFIEIFAGGKTADENEGAFIHIALKSMDCDKDIDRAEKAGAVVTVKAMNVDIASDPVKKVRIAFCKGLNGEILEFFQEK